MLGKELNGYAINSIHLNSDGTYVILAIRENEYVTALMNRTSDKEWYWGHYHTKRENALTDYQNRMN